MDIPMKVLLYFENIESIEKSGVGMALKHQMQALKSAGVEYTLNPDDDYDILHINTVFMKSAGVINAARKKGAKIIYHAHSTEEDFRNSFIFSNLVSKVVKQHLIWLYSMADLILTPTPYSKSLLQSYGIKVPIEYVSNGVDLNRFNPSAEKADMFRKYFGIRPDQKVVMSSGLWIRRKGILDFIEVARQFPDVKFVWFGQTALAGIPAEVRQAVTKNHSENVIFPGYMSGDIYEGAFAAADVFFFPSYEETEGIVVLEAMSCKTPVLVRDIPVYDGWLEADVNCYKGKTNKEFEDKLRQIFSGTAVNVRQAAYQTACDRSIENIGMQLKRFYEQVYQDETARMIQQYAQANDRQGKLNIGLFSDTYAPDVNGVSVSVQTLRKQLEKMGHNVYVITSSVNTKLVGSKFSDGVLRIPAIRLKTLYGYGISRPYSIRALQYIKAMNLDVCHVHTEFSMRIFASLVASVCKLPYVATYHTMYEDYTHYVTHGYFDKTAKKLVSWYSKYLAEKTCELIVPSIKTSTALERYGVTKYMHIVPTGIDLAKFDPQNINLNEIIEMQTMYGLSGKYCLGYVGRIAEEKNIDMIIQCLPRIFQQASDLVFVITGYGPDVENLQKQVHALQIENRVIFTGKQPPEQIQKYYAMCDAFITASTSETQGITYIEAMAAGLPVIARHDDCLSDVLIDGVTGFEFTDQDQLVDAVLRCYKLSKEAYSQMSQNCMKKASEYSLETFGKNVEDVYYQAIARKQRMLDRRSLEKRAHREAVAIVKNNIKEEIKNQTTGES